MSNHYILDSNVLLYDPDSINAYPDANVIIPISVIEEIDHFKKDITQTGQNARIVAQMLDQLRSTGSLTSGVKLANGAMLSVLIHDDKDIDIPGFLDPQLTTNKIIIALLFIQQNYKGKTTLITNNINLRIRVAALGIEASSFEEELSDLKKLYEEIQTKEITEDEFDRFLRKGFFKTDESTYYANQSIIFKCANSEQKITCRYHKEKQQFEPIQQFKDGVWGIHARNTEQESALDLLMDPSVQIVILAGKAGTGKTLLALAVALEQMLSSNLYTKVLVSRPIFPMGRDMGFLPGDVEEKMAPWMQPIFDNLDFLVTNQSTRSNVPGNYQRLLDKDLVNLEPLTYIRGRSIPNRFMIVDEAQNLTPHELKTIVTRVGEGTKLVLTGDPYQIDNPYVDPSSNGISYLIERFQHHSLAGHTNLIHGVRSELAELAANIL
ncbi:MAG: PhoH family protein [Proteobacteria bacterium]|nr:PhoH family protein [Pseudomonadota bacterium]